MDKIILKNQASFEIADGASLGNIQIKAENFDAIKTITDAFTADNLAEVTFTHNDAVSGKYTDLKSDGFTYMPNMGEDGTEDGTYTITVNLRTKTEMEKNYTGYTALKSAVLPLFNTTFTAIDEDGMGYTGVFYVDGRVDIVIRSYIPESKKQILRFSCIAFASI